MPINTSAAIIVKAGRWQDSEFDLTVLGYWLPVTGHD